MPSKHSNLYTPELHRRSSTILIGARDLKPTVAAHASTSKLCFLVNLSFTDSVIVTCIRLVLVGACLFAFFPTGGCAAATAAVAMAARAKARATWQQQQRQERGQRGNDSCKDNSKGDAARGDNAVMRTGYCGKGSGTVGSNDGGKSNGQRGNNSRVPWQWRQRQQGQQQEQQR